MIGVLIKYRENGTGIKKESYMEGNNYEQVLTKFLAVKGGKEKICIESIQDWDRQKKEFTIDRPITLEDRENVVYQVMNQ